MKKLSLKTDWPLVAIFAVLGIGAAAALLVRSRAEDFERSSLLNRAEIAGAGIHQENVFSLAGSPADIAVPEYQALKNSMIDIKSVNPDIRFVYLTGLRPIQSGEEKLFFYMDSEKPGTSGYSAPGDVYAETNAGQLAHYRSGVPFIEGPYQDSFGNWVTAWVPLADHSTGQIITMLGLDVDATLWEKRVTASMFLPSTIAISLALLLFLYWHFERRSRRYIEKIRKSEEEVEEQRNRLRTLYKISTRQDMSLADQIRAALATGNEKMYTKMAMLNRIEGDKFTVLHCVVPPDTLHEGDTFALHETYCDITVKKDDVVAISAMSVSEYKAHVCYTKFKLETYIGVPVKVSGQLFGTLTFLAPDPHRPEFSESDKDFVRLMGAWISATLERESIDTMKSEFVSVASHQLRTPLTGIKWFSELLLRGKAGSVSPDQKDFLTQIHDSNERMIKLVEDLLNVSRIETGKKFEIVKKPEDIVPIISSLATDLVGLAVAHKVEIKKLENFPKSFVLPIDADKIRQVFGNLMSNAVKYSHEGGTVTLGFEEKADMAVFSVVDTGLGIPESAKGRMFEKFFRADNVQTKETDGTGLGLYIAKAIAEGHGGSLTFQSEENKGTVFSLALPKNMLK